jgi:uncharacterized phage-associated protein
MCFKEKEGKLYPVEEIVEYVRYRTEETENMISNLKLQKVLYFLQAEFLIRFGYPCFMEAIEAWNFGPVVPSVYIEYQVYGAASIPYHHFKKGKYFPFSKEERKTMDKVIKLLEPYQAYQLTEITMQQTPWTDAYWRQNKTITNESLLQYFAK